jgi:hypothetical protein
LQHTGEGNLLDWLPSMGPKENKSYFLYLKTGKDSGEEHRFVECGAVRILQEPTFRRNASPPCSGHIIYASEKTVRLLLIGDGVFFIRLCNVTIVG